ncbi:MAG: hypothetical protein IK118_05275 [Clostridia bacterium]|nr:hypothetical protein [Clostridia bacterium]MBR5427739.1 hypothetical protein [Clostridia bacterium]
MDPFFAQLAQGDAERAQAIETYLAENYAPRSELQGAMRERDALEKNLDELRRTDAVREGLRKRGVSDPDYVIYRQHGVDGFSFDKNGEPEGLDEIVGALAGTPAGAVLLREKRGYSPGVGESPSANPFAPDSFNLTEQGRLMRSSPETARRLAAAARS